MCVGLVAMFVIALFIAVTISRRKRKGKLCHVNSITAEENHTYILKLQCIENKKLGLSGVSSEFVYVATISTLHMHTVVTIQTHAQTHTHTHTHTRIHTHTQHTHIHTHTQ